jgi:hypothetical protein
LIHVALDFVVVAFVRKSAAFENDVEFFALALDHQPPLGSSTTQPILYYLRNDCIATWVVANEKRKMNRSIGTMKMQPRQCYSDHS